MLFPATLLTQPYFRPFKIGERNQPCIDSNLFFRKKSKAAKKQSSTSNSFVMCFFDVPDKSGSGYKNGTVANTI